MIQRTAFKALLEHKGQLVLLGLTCLVESLSIVGQAWFFGTLINNLIFLEHTLADETNTIIYLFIAIIVRLVAHYVQEAVANHLGSAVKASLENVLWSICLSSVYSIRNVMAMSSICLPMV